MSANLFHQKLMNRCIASSIAKSTQSLTWKMHFILIDRRSKQGFQADSNIENHEIELEVSL